MARPNKQGLDYFPLDVGIFENDKMLAISGEFSVKGEIIVLRLLCEIYRNGYFVEFSELLKNKLARLGGLSGGLVDEVVRKLVKYEFFDGFVFSEYNILTSKNIQKVYLEASKRRKDIDLSQYWLLDEINVYINSPSSKINAHINAQNKEKESKVNNISLLEKEKQKSVCVDFSEGEKKEQPLNTEKETSPQVAPAPPPFNFRKAMLAEGFAPELVDEWLKIRKAKKAVNTERAFNNFINQVRLTNQDINAILSIIVQKQWKGFEADWLHNTQYHQPIANNQIIIDENGKIITNAEPYRQQSTVSKPPYFAGRQTLENIRNNSQGWGAHIVGDS
jgi:hypothetical protein|nr:MAG TPA: protein of unknown function (DUF4373) [Caudoviricetes sp.]